MRPMQPTYPMQSNAPQRLERPNAVRGTAGADPRCAICGSEAVVFDEVVEGPAIELGECLHCEHRWTLAGASQASLPGPEVDLDGADVEGWYSEVSNAA